MNSTSHSTPSARGGDHVLVGVAGIGAPVVPGNGERRSGHSYPNALSRRQIPLEPAAGRGSRTIPPAQLAEKGADGHAGDHIGGVVNPDVNPAPGHHQGEAVVQGCPLLVTVGEEGSGAEG